MNENLLYQRIETILDVLCNEIGYRHVGSDNNKRAAEYFYDAVTSFTFNAFREKFDCIDWNCGAVSLSSGGETFEAFVSPYSLPCSIEASLVSASDLSELESADYTGRILLIHGSLAKEQMMPKKFTFYNPEEHQRIISILEEKKPAAIITATGRNPELAGGWYPFPMFEDGDFDIPSVFMTDKEGERLVRYTGYDFSLSFDSERIPSTGWNVIAHKGPAVGKRIVLTAHIDTKKTTPGALDNGTGIAVLLALSELLQNYSGDIIIEIAALNGEDYFSAPGQMKYLETNHNRMNDILLAINIDGAGYTGMRSAFSFYECPDSILSVFREVIAKEENQMEGSPWPQGDHMIFVMNKRPAVAITSENFTQLSNEIAHTAKDTPELVSSSNLTRIAYSLKSIIDRLNQSYVE